ncbi:uncharacterized protein [Periplaneta americana]|uniref:uncharacterized protein n=1 Tax=Periplaneta americana TaxID=6978 RepID=UPI0037E720B4
MTWNKQHLCKEILSEVKNQMLLLNQSRNTENGRPNYSWLCQNPRLTTEQSEKLEELTMKLGEAECRTAVMAFRAELRSGTITSVHDVPLIMCQILRQLIEDCKTSTLLSAGIERRQRAPSISHTKKEATQDIINTVTDLVEGPSIDHTRLNHKLYLPQEEPGLYTLTVNSSCIPSAMRQQAPTEKKDNAQ